MRELSNMPAKEFSFKTLPKYNKVTIQSDSDDEDNESVNDDESANDDECINDDDDESKHVEIWDGDYIMVITIQSDNDGEDNESVNDDESANDDECINDDDESKHVEIWDGDYIMVIHELFRGYFAILTDKNYGDEFEIQYFQKKEKWWILKENYFDSHLEIELKLVKGRIDERPHYFF